MSKYLKPGDAKPRGSIKVVSGRSAWNRAVQNTSKAMVAHLGSDVTEPEAMLIRRIAVFESEMQLMELQIAKDRHFNVEPSDKFLDLYSGLVNSQRRLLETVGMKRVAKDVTPDLESYLKRTHET
ncbi:hypothetical protein [Bradyrhizobium sp.]|uniref:hypothetical protein n=1 Tax=Bradyrhizobium sp. TaxID=376 RepID=UPI003BB0E2BE